MKKPEVHLTVLRAAPEFRELGFVCEFQAFVDGKPLDNVQLSRDSSSVIVASYAEEYEVVYVNSIRATPRKADDFGLPVIEDGQVKFLPPREDTK